MSFQDDRLDQPLACVTRDNSLIGWWTASRRGQRPVRTASHEAGPLTCILDALPQCERSCRSPDTPRNLAIEELVRLCEQSDNPS